MDAARCEAAPTKLIPTFCCERCTGCKKPAVSFPPPRLGCTQAATPKRPHIAHLLPTNRVRLRTYTRESPQKGLTVRCESEGFARNSPCCSELALLYGRSLFLSQAVLLQKGGRPERRRLFVSLRTAPRRVKSKNSLCLFSVRLFRISRMTELPNSQVILLVGMVLYFVRVV